MRAVNLIPAEARKGAGGAAGRSGGAAYVLLGALAVLVVLMGLWVGTGRQVDSRKGELADVQRQAVAAQAKADKLQSYTAFAQLREQRVQTVTSLAGSRFDWSHALREVSRVVPKDTWLTSLAGTVTPGVQVEGAGGATSSLRSAVAAPAVEVTGCTTSQDAVATMMSRMRLIDGVQRVSLAASEKADQAGGGGGGGQGGDCRSGSDRRPQFSLVVFFAPKGGTTP